MDRTRETLRVEHRPNGTLLATLDRPAVANAFNTQAAIELCELFEGFRAEQPYRCVVITGAGEKAFCAGADLKERRAFSDEQWRLQHQVFERMFRAVRDCPIPVVAAVNGAAYAGGLELVLHCDFAYASTTARFALTEVALGIMPGGGGTQTLPRVVGERRAKELILSARPFSAEEALAWGLVNRLCDPATVVQEALQVAERVASLAPLAVRQAKHAIHQGLRRDLESGMELEIEAYERLVGTEDRREGLRAFDEKRAPKFEGR
ncbi:MAG TPA: enoyl-CoA hydratase-related protein [Burkholderiales bacterium]|nr:enoyl-CoA hydratase-related protein [Burkholderiales bacterium]